MAVVRDVVLLQRIPVEEHYGSDFTYEVIERPVGIDGWNVVETLSADKSWSSHSLHRKSVQLAVVSRNEIGEAPPLIVFSISADTLGQLSGFLSLVHTCHKMAPLNGTILWRHKIAPFFEAINLLLQNLWRHKLPLSCMKFHRYSLNTLNN